jgi:hypothetical protein
MIIWGGLWDPYAPGLAGAAYDPQARQWTRLPEGSSRRPLLPGHGVDRRRGHHLGRTGTRRLAAVRRRGCVPAVVRPPGPVARLGGRSPASRSSPRGPVFRIV